MRGSWSEYHPGFRVHPTAPSYSSAAVRWDNGNQSLWSTCRKTPRCRRAIYPPPPAGKSSSSSRRLMRGEGLRGVKWTVLIIITIIKNIYNCNKTIFKLKLQHGDRRDTRKRIHFRGGIFRLTLGRKAEGQSFLHASDSKKTQRIFSFKVKNSRRAWAILFYAQYIYNNIMHVHHCSPWIIMYFKSDCDLKKKIERKKSMKWRFVGLFIEEINE